MLRQARLALGLTMEQAADLADVSYQTWSRIEQGRAKTLTDGTLGRMAAVVRVSPEELVQLGYPEAAAVRARIVPAPEPEAPKPVRSAQLAEEYFRDTSVPLEKRREDAARFLEVLSYLLRGEEPPPPQPESGSKPQARTDRNSM